MMLGKVIDKDARKSERILFLPSCIRMSLSVTLNPVILPEIGDKLKRCSTSLPHIL